MNNLQIIEQKVFEDKRISVDEALELFASNDIYTIGKLAAYRCEKLNDKKVYYIQNCHINPTNLCVNRCAFCAFSRSTGEQGAYEFSIDEIVDKAVKAQSQGVRELHIVGGLHPERPFTFYTDLLKRLKAVLPSVHIKAFTAVEIDYFSKISGLSLENTLLTLKEAGLETMPGGGAEIFNEAVRNKICPEKISGQRWLEVAETAHRMGIRTNATMLYGHIESHADRVDHMARLREVQDRTGGFQAFIPLPFHPKNTRLDGGAYTSGIDDLKTIAIARIFLDNVPHIKAYWIMLGEKLAQLALYFGADDLEGTVLEEKITHSAGGLTHGALTRDELIHIIRKAGKEPVERDSLYKQVGA
ncbi:MAG TPA: aminofutalosine synthase MqnE [Thermodesulfovibrionia bacterium]|nr:aminofutalosine synthase MqnE [Thermodesulfovibrionia bacterium]